MHRLYLTTHQFYIHMWATSNHYQLLLPFTHSLPSLTQNLFYHCPPPQMHHCYRHPCSVQLTLHYRLPILLSPLSQRPKAFCPTNCHPCCHNHYSAFRTTPHQRQPPSYVSLQILATAETLKHPTLPHPTHSTFPITPTLQSTALTSLPLLELMYSANSPNL